MLTLEHLNTYHTIHAEAAPDSETLSPQLLPDYTRKENRGV